MEAEPYSLPECNLIELVVGTLAPNEKSIRVLDDWSNVMCMEDSVWGWVRRLSRQLWEFCGDMEDAYISGLPVVCQMQGLSHACEQLLLSRPFTPAGQNILMLFMRLSRLSPEFMQVRRLQ
jgi:hypothetical protein